MENKLIPMTTFVLEIIHTPNVNEDICWEQTEERLQKIYRYTLFLKQPLELWMFIPCENNVPLEEFHEPNKEDYWDRENDVFNSELYNHNRTKFINFKKAKSRVLFEDAVKIDRSPYKCTQRLLIDLAVDTPFRIYTEFRYPDGNIERTEFPNQKKLNTTIEDLVSYNLTLTETVIKQIYEQ